MSSTIPQGLSSSGQENKIGGYGLGRGEDIPEIGTLSLADAKDNEVCLSQQNDRNCNPAPDQREKKKSYVVC
jgi:hypothetical protein